MIDRSNRAVIDEVISRAPILDVIGETVRLQRRGNRYLGLCPFHGEKTPSFNVNPARNMFHCFGCGASGDVIGFVMKSEGLTFPEALRKLAERFGVELPERRAETEFGKKASAERDAYFQATKFAADFFRAELVSGKYPEPLAYLRDRGIDAETAAAFGLGWAPSDWTKLVDYAGSRGMDPRALMDAGLVGARNDSGYFDRFRGRVMFPIVNLSGKVLAFSGRTLDPEEKAKYINSSETSHYTKGRELFGLNAAQRRIRELGTAIIVEGNFDAVSMHAHGFTNTVASLGTALTEHQARLIKRFTERVILLFDGDKAGRAAANRALETFLGVDMPQILIAELPDGVDPDDFVRKQGDEAMRTLLAGARPMLEVRLETAIRPAAGLAPIAAKRAALDSIAGLLRPVRNAIVLDQHVQDVSRRLEVDVEQILDLIKTGPRPRTEERAEETESAIEPFDRFEQMLINLLADNSEFLDTIRRNDLTRVLRHPQLQLFISNAARNFESSGTELVESIGELGDGPLKQALHAALVSGPEYDPDARQEAFDATVNDLKIQWLVAKIRVHGEELRAAESGDSDDAADELMEEMNRLMMWLTDLRRERAERSGRSV